MEKQLNTSFIHERMLQLGLSQTELAEKLEVTKTAISSWLKPEKFPRPRHLLKLAELLKLSFDEIVLKKKVELQPSVAFRKSGNHKILDSHREHFYYISRLLCRLVPYLPFDDLMPQQHLRIPELIITTSKKLLGPFGKKSEKAKLKLRTFWRSLANCKPLSFLCCGEGSTIKTQPMYSCLNHRQLGSLSI